MKVINTFVVIVVILAVAIPAYLWNEAKTNHSPKWQYESNWQLQLPSEFKELDQYTNQGDFVGRECVILFLERKKNNCLQ